MGNQSNKRSHGVRSDLDASQRVSSDEDGLTVVLEIVYDAQTEREARLRALRDAETLFQQYDVLAVTADAKKPDPSEQEQIPGQMTVDDCIDTMFPVTKEYLAGDE